MNRFKVGDRVVVVNDDSEFYSTGDYGVILDVKRNLYVEFEYQKNEAPGERWYVNESGIEIYAVYNSPLYKALS
jgi:hypothetical protein